MGLAPQFFGAYFPHPLTDKRNLVMDLTFKHDRYGSSKKA